MEELVSYKTAILAKEVGFNWKVRRYYGHVYNPHIAYDKEDYSIPVDFNSVDNSHNYKDLISAPTQSLLNRWLRDIHKYYIDIFIHSDGSYCVRNIFDISSGYDISIPYINYKIYEEALEYGLEYVLNLIKEGYRDENFWVD